MTRSFHTRLVLLFGLLALLGGCSGDDDTTTTPGVTLAPSESNDWDALIWDQDKWA